jgi:cell division protein ZapA
MAEVALKIKIANREYPLSVEQEEADNIQRAAALVNENIQKLKGAYVVNDYVDLLAMTALELATGLVDRPVNEAAPSRETADSLNQLSQRIAQSLEH